MNASSVVGGSFLKAEDLKASGPQKLTIASVGVAEFDSKKIPGAKERRLELTLSGGKQMTLNVTNTRALIDAYGDDTDGWVGRGFVAYYDPNISMAGRRVGGTRLRIGGPAAAAADTIDKELGF